jgi:purine-cytosine permease-like protein
MKHLTPGRLVFIGFLLALLGVVLPFLMVMEVIKSTFFLNFVSFIVSLIGVIIGVMGSIYYVRIKRGDE